MACLGIPISAPLDTGVSIAYSPTLGRYAVLGIEAVNRIVTSDDDGLTWDAQTTPFDGLTELPTQIIWVPETGLFVALADMAAPSFLISSPDGVTWTSHPTALDGNYYALGVAYSAALGLYVVTTSVGSQTIQTSPDLVTWTAHSSPFDNMNCEKVSWSPPLGLFVAVGGRFGSPSGDGIATSTNGSVWTARPNPLVTSGTSVNLVSVAWCPQSVCFVVAGAGDGDAGPPNEGIMRSVDGITWVLAALPDDNFCQPPSMPLYELADGNIIGGYCISGTAAWVLSNDGGFSFAPFDSTSGDQILGFISAAGWTLVVGSIGDPDQPIGILGSSPSGVATQGPVAPLWRYFIADLDGFGITDYSKLASDRVVEVVLNAPLSMSGTVPSDDPQVWTPYDVDTFDDPYLNEGTRLLWGFRQENECAPYWEVRGATLVQLVQDTAAQDNARTRFQGWDPWHYLLSRPVMDAFGNVPGVNGLSFTNTQASVIIATLLRNTIDAEGHAYVDAGDGSRSGDGPQYQDYSGTAFYTGTLETGAGMEIDINFAQGTSVGQAWQQITNMGVCDIVLEPIYDPMNRPNYLVQLNVFAQAGAQRDEAIFAWNMPGRSLVGIDRQEDGSQRANSVFFRAGQGGWWGDGTIITDGSSLSKYGSYWAQQFFPEVTGKDAISVVNFLAEQQLGLRANGRETVTFTPAPERSPRPWLDYELGDRVPVWASGSKFRKPLGTVIDGTFVETAYQRIYGWTANISDDALETIDPVLVSPEVTA